MCGDSRISLIMTVLRKVRSVNSNKVNKTVFCGPQKDDVICAYQATLNQ